MASTEKKSRVKREIIAVSCLFLAVFIGCCLVSYNPSDPSYNTVRSSGIRGIHNWGGIVGSYLADALFQLIGLSALLVPVMLLWIALKLFFTTKLRPDYVAMVSCGFLMLSLSGLMSLGWGDLKITLASFSYALNGGGVVGSQLAGVSFNYLNQMGSYTLFSLVGIVSLIAITHISLLSLVHYGKKFFSWWIRGMMCLPSLWVSMRDVARALYRGIAKGVGAAEGAFSHWKMKYFLHQEETHAQPEMQPVSLVKEPERKPRKKVSSPPTKSQGAEGTYSSGEYQVSPLSLLDNPPPRVTKNDKETIRENSRVLENKLGDFGVQGKVTEVHPGPVITRYEFEPASGVRISKILGLTDDLALALKAFGIRILAPVPGKAVVGIEIPNVVREIVHFKEIVGREEFLNAQSKLTLALGKDIAGKPIITDLAKMPHLLIAGSTGSGKSVLINALICSILYKANPSEVKFLLIDPKRLELSFYEDIPHLLHPVVIDPKKASVALRWTVGEMERRYQMLAEKGVRDIDGYNRAIDTEKGSAKKREREEGEDDLMEKKLPYILVVIDELADLMMVSSREVESSITRLAQMARAAGIHLLVATQRPSVDVLTGTIKVNFPARISFQVSSKVDSRTILDTIGAERLLGRGDMLFLPPGTSMLVRVHGTYLSEEEIKRITDFLKKQGTPEYNQSILETREESVVEGDEEYDERYDDAVALVTQTRMASISMIQRRLRIGYNRAARIIERMEKEGVVGPSDGVKPREVLVRR